jgi:hypothetical protein|tara:strand:- start:239 stop:376 length:138 start_codon:yes stop_codon:yes gene_type:complete
MDITPSPSCGEMGFLLPLPLRERIEVRVIQYFFAIHTEILMQYPG